MEKFDWKKPAPLVYFAGGAFYGFIAGGMLAMRLLGW